VFSKKILLLAVITNFCCFLQSSVHASSSSAPQVSLLTSDEVQGIFVENIRNFLDDHASEIIGEFLSFVHVVPKEEGDHTSVPAFIGMLEKVVRNPAGYFVVKQIILALQEKQNLGDSIANEESRWKDEIDTFKKLQGVILKKATMLATPQPGSSEPPQPNFDAIPQKIRTQLADSFQSVKYKTRILDLKKGDPSKKFILQVKLLSIASEDISMQAFILSNESFMKDPNLESVGELSFTDADLVSVTRGVPDVPNKAEVVPIPSEFLFFHELLHFSHLIVGPDQYERYKVKDFKDPDLMLALRDMPLSDMIFQARRTDLYSQIVAPWKKIGVSVLSSIIFGPREDKDGGEGDVLVSVVDPEELATIAGINNGNTLFFVSENTYRMFYNSLYDTTYPLRYAHWFMVDQEEAFNMTKEMISWMRFRAVAGVSACVSFFLSGVLK
jgi:hypothetical protein